MSIVRYCRLAYRGNEQVSFHNKTSLVSRLNYKDFAKIIKNVQKQAPVNSFYSAFNICLLQSRRCKSA